MHEMSLATSIIEIAREELAKATNSGGEIRVQCLRFRAGMLHNIVPDSLTFYYDLMKIEDPRLEQSRLEITLVEERAKCRQCGCEFPIDAPIFVCPSCSGPADIIDGKDMYVESIEFD